MEISTRSGVSELYAVGTTKFGNHSLVWHPPNDPERAYTFIRKQTRFNKTANEHYMYYVCQDCRLIRDREVKERPACEPWSAPRITLSTTQVVIRSPEETLNDHRCPRKTTESLKGVTRVKLTELQNTVFSGTNTPSTPSSMGSKTPSPPPLNFSAESPSTMSVTESLLSLTEGSTPNTPLMERISSPMYDIKPKTELVQQKPRSFKIVKRKLDQVANDLIKKRTDEEPFRKQFPTYNLLLDYTRKLIEENQKLKMEADQNLTNLLVTALSNTKGFNLNNILKNEGVLNKF